MGTRNPVVTDFSHPFCLLENVFFVKFTPWKINAEWITYISSLEANPNQMQNETFLLLQCRNVDY